MHVQKEVIKAAALKHKDTGKIYSVPKPGRHHDVIRVIHEEHKGDPRAARKVVMGSTQGFVTSHDRFVDRYEALVIAKRVGQLIKEWVTDRLYSEDVW